MSSIDISIIGAGSWGKALAHVLLNNNKKVLIYSRNPNLKCYENNSNVILTNDIMEVPEEEIKNVSVVATIVNGSIVFQKIN